jgi:hypothetical protein
LKTTSLVPYRERVPNQPKTPSRSIRVDDTDWAELGRIAEAQGSARGKLINELLAWYLGRPGAELPERPSSVPADPGRTVRIDAQIWDDLPAPDTDPHGHRSRLINQILSWYLNRPADLPTPGQE